MRPNHRPPAGPAECSAPGTRSVVLDPRMHRAARGGIRARRTAGLAALSFLVTFAAASPASAATVGLGNADAFGVLGGSAVTNTGPTVLTGDLGLAPGSAVSGFGPGTVLGTTHVNDAVATLAQNDLGTAYGDAASRPSTATVAGDLAGRTLVGGVYTSATTVGLSGELVLDGQGDPDAVFVFQAGSTLTTGPGSRVRLIGGARSCNVFWQVGSSATIGSGSTFVGNVLALTSITLTAGVTVDGRLLARNGAVTLDSDVVTRSTCAPAGGGTSPTPGGSTPPVAGPSPVPGGGGGTGSGAAPTAGSTTPGAPTAGPDAGGSSAGTTGTPLADTRPATAIRPGTATVTGTVRSGEGTTTYYFDYGTTDGYGRRSPTTRAPGGASAKKVRRTLRGLRASRTYHYRVVVLGPGGRRVYGRDRTFRTRARPVSRLPRTSGGFAG